MSLADPPWPGHRPAGDSPAARPPRRPAPPVRCTSHRASNGRPQRPARRLPRALPGIDREHRKHPRRRLPVLAPVPPGEGDPGNLLAGTEAVIYGATWETVSPEIVMDTHRKRAPRCGQGCPAGLSIAKSADAENAGAMQYSPKQRPESACRTRRSPPRAKADRSGSSPTTQPPFVKDRRFAARLSRSYRHCV